MASNFFPIADTPHGLGLKQGVRQLQTGISQLLGLQAIMVQAIDTAPNPDDYTAMETAFGLQAGAGAGVKAELDSLLAKFTTDASVTEVLAARNQIAAKFGVFV